MSYLGFPRLHFSGRFQADVPTVNNDPAHFNNTTFLPEYQEYQEYQGDELVAPNGWWNPGGSDDWRFIDCVVNKVYYLDGNSCDNPDDDPVIGMQINPAQNRGKIVDLDSENQNVSEIWCFQVILDNRGSSVFQGDFKVVGFADLWFNRSPILQEGSGDSKASAFYQSIIENINLSGLAGSQFFDELGTFDKLSIKFTVDRYRLTDESGSEDYTRGRIVGVIGPYEDTEPYSFVPGRLLYPKQIEEDEEKKVGEFDPGKSTFCYAPCIIDRNSNKLLVDLANSFQAEDNDTSFYDVGNLQVAVKIDGDQYKIIGPINYRDPDWYIKEVGIETFSELPPEVLDHQLAVVQAEGDPGQTVTVDSSSVFLLEHETGLFARADKFVFRLSSNNDNDQSDQTTLYAYRFGQPESKKFYLKPDSDLIKPFETQSIAIAPGPEVATPDCGLMLKGDQGSFEPLGDENISVTTGIDGTAIIELKGTLEGTCFEDNPYSGNPDGNILGGPRGYIDGQVYGVYFLPEGEPINDDPDTDPSGTNSSSNLLNVLVWNKYEIPAEPTWVDDVQTIFTQYANLYPVMRDSYGLDLANYDNVINSKGVISRYMELDINDAAYMPVTRDLSPAKRQMLLNWLELSTPPRERNAQKTPTPPPQTPDFKQIALSILAGLALFGLGYVFWH